MNYKSNYIKIIGIVLVVILFYVGYRYFTKKDNIQDIITDIEYNDIEKEVDWSSFAISDVELDSEDNIVEGITYEESSLIIKQSGIYNLSGKVEGSIIVDAKDADVELILNGVDITSPSGPAIYVKKANLVLVTLAENTENKLIDSNSYEVDAEGEPNGTIFSKSDLVIEGEGKLTINSNYEDAIVSKDKLKINSGIFNITSVGDGIRGKDAVIIKDANITIDADCDGIKSTNANDENLGYVLIENGIFNITSTQDAIQTETNIVIKDGSFNIKTGGGSGNTKSNDSWGYWGRGNYNDSDSESAKGIKAGGSISISGGAIDIDTSDDSIHSNGSILISGGNYSIASGDDGIHADTNLIIEAGTITINQSYEGLEATELYIKDGNISITASDDGINAAGGNDTATNEQIMSSRRDMFSKSTGALYISGGTLYVNADGDGLDANGDIEMTGGNVIVEGPTNSGNGALDYDGTFNINGGTLFVIGSSGMAQSPSISSTQYSLHFNISSKNADSTIVIKDNEGNEIISHKANKQYSSIIVSTPNILKGKDYTLTIDNSDVATITTSSTVTKYGTSGGMGNPGGMPGGMRR